ncbi:hypothetical protein PABG_12375 [Paracoccidioides brasiliensis Pb03]|nr:hypothetical protein PABG_12375 [Paracoccidioides brasiliensis Pb03]
MAKQIDRVGESDFAAIVSRVFSLTEKWFERARSLKRGEDVPTCERIPRRYLDDICTHRRNRKKTVHLQRSPFENVIELI